MFQACRLKIGPGVLRAQGGVRPWPSCTFPTGRKGVARCSVAVLWPAEWRVFACVEVKGFSSRYVRPVAGPEVSQRGNLRCTELHVPTADSPYRPRL